MEKSEITIIVHAQKGCFYTRHSSIRNLERYAPEAIHLVSREFERSLFKTRLELPTYVQDDGSFNPEALELYLRLNPERLNHLKVTLVGGELEACLTKAYHCIDIWQKNSPIPMMLETHLPLDAVFSLDSIEKRISTLREMGSDTVDQKNLTSLLLITYCSLKGTVPKNIQWTEDEIVLMNKKPYGIFDTNGAVISDVNGLLVPSLDLR